MNPVYSSQPMWTAADKFAFRFFCCLFIFYIFPFPLDSAPFVTELTKVNEKLTSWYTGIFEAYTNLGHKFIPWVARSILHFKTPITIFSNRSGDTTYDYVLLLTVFVLAALTACIWTLADRNRKSFNLAFYWLRVLVRYYLAYNLVYYGFSKVFHVQMTFPYLSQLVQRFGDKSPMGLAWSFVGYSPAYSAYTGWAEVVGGTLLLFRRTITLGAITSAVVMLNVAVLNYTFDIPVKLFSSMLLLMTIFLAVPDAGRLWNVLVLNRPTRTVYKLPGTTVRWQRITCIFLKWLFILYTFYSSISSIIQGSKEYGDNSLKPPLYGIYNTKTFVVNGDTLPPLATDTTRWKQTIIQSGKSAQVTLMTDSLRYYRFIVDTLTKSISIYTYADTLHKSTLYYRVDSSLLTLRGKIHADSVYMQLLKYDINKFRLVNRGYHWINEYPYNR